MKTILLTRNKVALVSDEDFDRVSQFKWHTLYSGNKNWTPYAARKVHLKGKRTALLMHRFLLDAEPNMQVDHINGDGLDNRRQNLRLCTGRENTRAFKRKRVKATSLFRGVSFHSKTKKWCAQIQVHGKPIHLGLFINEVEAAKTYDKAAQQYFGKFASLNFK